MSEVLTTYQSAKAAAEEARAAMLARLEALDTERAEIKLALGRKPHVAKAAGAKKPRKAKAPAILPVEA
jgi:outer membrane protein TolC